MSNCKRQHVYFWNITEEEWSWSKGKKHHLRSKHHLQCPTTVSCEIGFSAWELAWRTNTDGLHLQNDKETKSKWERSAHEGCLKALHRRLYATVQYMRTTELRHGFHLTAEQKDFNNLRIERFEQCQVWWQHNERWRTAVQSFHSKAFTLTHCPNSNTIFQ